MNSLARANGSASCLLVVLLINAAYGWCGDEPASEAATRVETMARRIDELLAERWQQEGVSPAAVSSDEEFLRRVYLDLTGVIPRVSEVREFIADPTAEKRARVIQRLLSSPAYATHQASLWRGIMLPDGFAPEQINNAVGLQNWLREQFVRNLRYDRLVADFLVSGGGDEIGPALFYTSQELQPEKLAASTARIFLGLQIECAQCHNHPFDRWKQRDFWSYAAFFARLDQSSQMMVGGGNAIRLIDRDAGEVKLPDTEDVVFPAYPGSGVPSDEQFGSRRMQLAVWMASRDNPYLARAAVNRAWSQLFGRGLVEPVDDLGPHNPPSHPELLDELADYFVRIRFDWRQLQQTLCMTQAYQLSSCCSSEAVMRPEWFARMAIKPLSAEQLYDSLNQALGRRLAVTAEGVRANSRLFDPQRQAFLIKMATNSRSPSEYQAGVPQALTLMNGVEMAAATDPAQGGLLAALAAPFFSDRDRIETLFLATFSRRPDDDERSVIADYVAAQPDAAVRRRAWGDVLWALLNSSEFALNH